jgi:Flp pilus assembly pilin Flp
MQTIVHRTEEVTLQAYAGLRRFAHSVVDRARDSRGQTAAEYMGLLLVVAVIIGALATSGIGGKISGLANGMIDSVAGGNKAAPTAPAAPGKKPE